MNNNCDRSYKVYQKLYNQLVINHTDDFSLMEFIEDSEIVNNALKYFKEATFPLIYPAKSYSVAIIYATLIEMEYGIPLRETLNDDDLFLGQDDFFVPYHADSITYEKIIDKLRNVPNWINSGWASKTKEYFYLECTEEGINKINKGTT